MPDLLKTGSDWLGGMFRKHASQRVLYSRSAAEVGLMATIGRTEWEIDAGESVLTKWESRDFLCDAAELVLPGVGLTTPAAGDQIKEMDGSTVHVYEVCAPASVPVFEYADPYRNRLRIHTKEVDTE